MKQKFFCCSVYDFVFVFFCRCCLCWRQSCLLLCRPHITTQFRSSWLIQNHSKPLKDIVTWWWNMCAANDKFYFIWYIALNHFCPSKLAYLSIQILHQTNTDWIQKIAFYEPNAHIQFGIELCFRISNAIDFGWPSIKTRS